MALHFEVAVTALVGAFACGAMYVLKGMLPSRDESFWHRAFISVFLSIVLASLVLILPGTFGAHALGRGAQQTIVDIAGALPLARGTGRRSTRSSSRESCAASGSVEFPRISTPR